MLFLAAPAPPAMPASSPPAVRASPSACVRPNVAAFVLRAEPPVTPPEAVRLGAQGTVNVIVSIDALSHVTAVRIASTPSALLNSAALEATLHSAFQAEIYNCVPVARDYIYSVDFIDDPEAGDVPSAPAFYTTNPPTAVVTAGGRTSLPAAAVAGVQLEFVGRGTDAPAAVAAVSDGYERFVPRLFELGITQPPREYYDVFSPTSSTGAYVARYGVRLSVGTARLGEILRLAAQCGATSARVRFGETPDKAALAAAVAAAMPDAAAQARQVAAKHGLRLGDVVRTFMTYVSPPRSCTSRSMARRAA
jgi:uncharacterized protein YggE